MSAMAVYNINATPSATTGIIPFEYAYNKKIRGIGKSSSESSISSLSCINKNNPIINKISTKNLLLYHQNTYRNTDKLGRRIATRKRIQYKEYYDKKYNTNERLEIGTYVKFRATDRWLPVLSFFCL